MILILAHPRWSPKQQRLTARIILKRISLSEWLALLEQRHPVAIDLGLDRIEEVARRLSVLVPAAQVISVAGTNGKGSCVTLLETMLLAGDSKVGAFTSPHLLAYNERIRINTKPVDDELICAAFADIERAREDISLTYFEFSALAALWVFKQQEVDIALLEVGLGGRLDAVNIVDADVAIITSIDLDHQDWLGDDRESIAIEKAGIARAGKPLVCGDPDPPESLLASASEIGAVDFMLGTARFNCREETQGSGPSLTLTLTCTSLQDEILTYRGLPRPQLPRASALCAVQALICAGRTPNEQVVCQALAETSLAGRFQQARFRQRAVILDVAHNPAAAELLTKQLKAYLKTSVNKKVYGLFGALADKDIEAIIRPLLPVIDTWQVCDLEGVQRAAGAEDIAAHLAAHGVSAATYGSVSEALLSQVEQMTDNDVLVVFGSFYTVAEALDVIGNNVDRDNVGRDIDGVR